jgi:hypothetical protein
MLLLVLVVVVVVVVENGSDQQVAQGGRWYCDWGRAEKEWQVAMRIAIVYRSLLAPPLLLMCQPSAAMHHSSLAEVVDYSRYCRRAWQRVAKEDRSNGQGGQEA